MFTTERPPPPLRVGRQMGALGPGAEYVADMVRTRPRGRPGR
jgi:hypothetical protein